MLLTSLSRYLSVDTQREFRIEVAAIRSYALLVEGGLSIDDPDSDD